MSDETIKTYQGGLDCGQALVTLEGFIGDVDGKTIAIAGEDNTFIDDGVVDTADAVTAINALIWSLERRDAEIGRLREERRALQRMAWLVIKKFGGCVLRSGDMEDYPGDDRIIIITAENPMTKAVSYSAGTADQQGRDET